MRKIYADIKGWEVQLSGKTAGIQGERNATALIVRMDESWRGYGKRLVWRDATSENPVSLVLFDPDVSDSETLEYTTAIPQEAMALPGWPTFVVEGWKVVNGHEVVALAATGTLEVISAPVYYAPSSEPTPSEYAQLMEKLGEVDDELDRLHDDMPVIQDAKEASVDAAQRAEDARDRAERAEPWAVGQLNGVDVPNTDPAYQNNAKYYAQQSMNILQGMAFLQSTVNTKAGEAATSAQNAATSEANAEQKAVEAAASAAAADKSAQNAQSYSTSALQQAQVSSGCSQIAIEKALEAKSYAEQAQEALASINAALDRLEQMLAEI